MSGILKTLNTKNQTLENVQIPKLQSTSYSECLVNRKNEKIAELISRCDGGNFDPHYVCFFECFNRGLYYEAHEVLERIWLPDRKGPNGSFYKGLIQLAGAFVHLQKGRPQPSAALFKLARTHLQKYPSTYQKLDLSVVIRLIESWLARLETGQLPENLLTGGDMPKIELSTKT